MPTWEKFGQDRHRPAGEWVQATLVEDVVGVAHRKHAAFQFATAVRSAERRSLHYGIALELEPNNPHDRHAIKVIGMAEQRRFFGGTRRSAWHIGYLPRETSSELHQDLLSQGIPIAAELYYVFLDRDFVDLKIIVLAPPGHSHGARRERAAAADTIEGLVSRVKALKREKRLDEAEQLLLSECDRQEADSAAKGWGVAPWYYEQLAIIYRQSKRFDDELAILERYDRQLKAPGAKPAQLKARLDDVRTRREARR